MCEFSLANPYPGVRFYHRNTCNNNGLLISRISGMKKEQPQKIPQAGYVQSALRMPAALRTELRQAAERNGRSMNAEILARLQATPTDTILAEITELKQMIKRLLDRD